MWTDLGLYVDGFGVNMWTDLGLYIDNFIFDTILSKYIRNYG